MIPINPAPSQAVAGRKVIIAEHQEGVRPLPAWVTDEGLVITRWRLTDEERQRITAGADLWLTILSGNAPLQPIALGTRPGDLMEGWPDE